jgi:hypothetical protein
MYSGGPNHAFVRGFQGSTRHPSILWTLRILHSTDHCMPAPSDFRTTPLIDLLVPKALLNMHARRRTVDYY